MRNKKRTNARVENHDSHVGLHSFADLHHLLEELGLLLMSTRCIHDDDLEPLLLELGYTLRRNGDRIGLGVRTEVCDLRLRGGLSRLVKSTGTKRIGTNDT